MHEPPKQGKKSREGGGDLKPRKRREGGREGNQEKRYATRTSRHATLTKLLVQRRQNVGTWLAYAPQQHTTEKEFSPMLSMVNATNADIVMQQRYKRPTRHQRTPKTLATIAPSR